MHSLPDLLKIVPDLSGYYKIGVDSDRPAICAVRNSEIFVESAQHEDGQYPDGAYNCGFPVEFYNHADPGQGQFTELEMLSPLKSLTPGQSMTFTVRWKLEPLQSADNATGVDISQVVDRLMGDELADTR